MSLKQFDLALFLNKFYVLRIIENKKLLNKLKLIYGLNFYSILQLSIYFGLKLNFQLNSNNFDLFFWTNLFNFLKKNFNFFLFNKKLKNIKKIKISKSYKGWRHIFKLPTRGQRSHTNAKTRKKFNII